MFKQLAVVKVVTAAFVLLTVSAPLAWAGQEQGVTVDLTLAVERDGILSVTEKVTVPEGQEAARRAPLRLRVGEHTDRVFTVRKVQADGSGTAEATGSELMINAGEGVTTVQYTVDGTVAELRDRQEIRWVLAGGWDTELASVKATMTAPVQESSPIRCLSGAAGSGAQCTLAEIDQSGAVRAEQTELAAGDRVELSVGLPSATFPANARFADLTTLASAFDVTTVVIEGFVLTGGLVVLWFGFLFWARRRDARPPDRPDEPAEVLVREDGRVFFASPDGVLPGQVGAVVDGVTDVVDVSATLVDLAVRNYLRIASVDGPDGLNDWRFSRRNDPDQSLHPYERAVFTAVLPSGVDSVLLSELRGGHEVDLAPVHEALYDDVVRRGWFSRRPVAGRGKAGWVGIGLLIVGALLTVTLALSAGHALLGVTLMLAGCAVLATARLVPPRTARGRALARQIRGLIDYLHSIPADEIPAADRELVFSRSLPYAVVLGETERWLSTFETLDPAADGASGLYWFDGLDGDRDLRRLGTHLPALLTALGGVLAEAGHLRSLR